MTPILAVVASVALVSLLALIGIVLFAVRTSRLELLLVYLIAFAAGTLLGDVFLHLFPEAVETFGFDVNGGLLVLAGLSGGFVIEKYIAWHHHHDTHEDHPETFSYMILVGDAIHNLIDGIIIAASYLVSIPLGVATTTAIAFHEIPQEVGDFGVLVYGGVTVRRALGYNLLTALTAFLGAGFVLLVGDVEWFVQSMIPLAAGNFIYIAGSDLLPEVAREGDLRRSTLQMGAFLLGVAVMYALTL